MKTKLSILVVSALVALPLFALTTFAASGPPGIDLGFGNDGDPPAVTAGDSNPSSPAQPEQTLAPTNNTQSGSTPTTTTATPKAISKSGPEMAILIIPSLLGGYLYRRRKNK